MAHVRSTPPRVRRPRARPVFLVFGVTLLLGTLVGTTLRAAQAPATWRISDFAVEEKPKKPQGAPHDEDENAPRASPKQKDGAHTTLHPLPPRATPWESLPPWMLSYVDLHRQWVTTSHPDVPHDAWVVVSRRDPPQNTTTITTTTTTTSSHGKDASLAQARPPWLQWVCLQRGACGGLGDRIYGMIMGLYMSLLSGRLYLIREWESPATAHPLEDYLQANLVQWKAKTDANRRPAAMLTTVDNRNHPLLLDPCGLATDPRDYELRNNLMTYEGIFRQTDCLQDYWKEAGGGPPPTDNRSLAHIGFWTLFRFTARVEEQARILLRQVGLVAAASSPHPFYLAVHIRTGQGQTWQDPARHDGVENMEAFYQCTRRLQDAVQKRCTLASRPPVYVAADTVDAKEFFQTHSANDDGSLKANLQMEVFHIDRSVTHKLQNVSAAYDNVWGELKVLIDATCLVMSHSKFSTLAWELSDQQPRCAVYFDDCDEDRVQQAVSVLDCS